MLHWFRGYGIWLRVFSTQKIFNLLKVYSGYWFSGFFRRPLVWGKPFSISVEPVAGCNLSCPACPAGNHQLSRPFGYIDETLFRKVVDENRSTLLWMNLYLQGEPFLHPSLTEMIRYADKAGIYTVVSTNGHFLSGQAAKETVISGLKRLIVCVDGVDQHTYVAYRRGGELSRVLDGIRNVAHWKKELQRTYPKLIIQFLVTRKNEHQTGGIKELARLLEADRLQIKTARLTPPDDLSEWMPSQDFFSRYRKTPGGYELKNKLNNHCLRLWTTAVMTWQGDLIPCCFDKDAGYRFGNLGTGTMESYWKSSTYMRFRQKVLKNRQALAICCTCCEGMKVITDL